MALLTVQKPSLTGVAVTYGAAAGGGDNYNGSGKEFILIKNGDSSPHTITIASQALCDQGFTHNIAVAVANGTEVSIGPFPVARFNDNGGLVQITYSAVTSMTIAIVASS